MDRLEIFRKRAVYQQEGYFHHTKNTVITIKNRHFRQLPACAKRIIEIDVLIYLFWINSPKFNNGVKYLLVCVDVSSRFVRFHPMKSKYSTDTVAAFKKMLRKNNVPQKVWVDQGTKFGGEFRKFCGQKNKI